MSKKAYILDTSVYLSNFNAIYAFKNNDIIMPVKVLEEIDKHKNRLDSVGMNARLTIRTLDELREAGSLVDGVKLGKGLGKFFIAPFISSQKDKLPLEMDLQVPDNIIISCAILLKQEEEQKEKKRDVVLVSRDVHMRVIAQAYGVRIESYDPEDIVDNKDELYTGFKELLVDDELIDRFYDGEQIVIDEAGLCPNQFLMLISTKNNNKTALARYLNPSLPLKKVKDFSKGDGIRGIRAKNKEQSFAFDLLLDPNVPLVTLSGLAGSGKTLLAASAALHHLEITGLYTRIIICRPVQPVGKDIGYLPGMMQEKLMPWLSPIQDNLRTILGNDKFKLDEYLDSGIIELEALTYIRGRSINNAFIIFDETQNMSKHEIKTILTRVGENTKVVLTGDVEQIDNPLLNATSNGFSYAIEKLKEYDLSGHITLKKGERSKIATLAAKIL